MYNWTKHNRKLAELMRDMGVRSYEGDRMAKDYIMEEIRLTNYGKIEADEFGRLPEEIFNEK